MNLIRKLIFAVLFLPTLGQLDVLAASESIRPNVLVFLIDDNKPFFLYMAHYSVHVPIMSDNGGLSARHRGGQPHTHNRPLSSGKGPAREGGIRVPMLVKWPGVVRPKSEH